MNRHESTEPTDHSDHSDRLAVVERLSPPPASEPDVERLLARTHRLIDAEGSAPRRHRGRVVVGGVAALLVAGGGVATAAVVHDHQHIADEAVRETRAVPGSSESNTPERSTLHEVLSIPGPRGLEYQAWRESTVEGGFCLLTLYAEPGDTNPPVNDGGTCEFSRTDHGVFAQGTAGTEYEGPEPGLNFVYSAPGVASASLRLTNGTTLPVVVRNGWLGGWFPASRVPCDVTATVVADDAQGHELGTFEVQTAGC